MEHLVFVRLMDEPGLQDKLFKGIAELVAHVSPSKKGKTWRNLKDSSNHPCASVLINWVKRRCHTEWEDLLNALLTMYTASDRTLDKQL